MPDIEVGKLLQADQLEVVARDFVLFGAANVVAILRAEANIV
jgi:hypothetical protein